MKTRIKIVEYGDGNKEYFPQVKSSFSTLVSSSFSASPFAFVIFSPLALLLCFIASICWLPIYLYGIEVDEYEYPPFNENYVNKGYCLSNLTDAQQAINDLIVRYAKTAQQKKVDKLAKTIVKTTYLD